MTLVVLHRVVILVAVVLAAFAGVAHRRVMKGISIWERTTLLYTLVAAAFTLFVLKLLGIAP